jgi:hypothetical protein
MEIDHLGDWRIEAASTLASDVPPAFVGGPSFKSGDRVYLTTLTKTSKGELIGFTTPNTSAMAINIAIEAATRAASSKQQLVFRSGPSPDGLAKSIGADQCDLLFSFFESTFVAVTFSFQALEAFCNYSISRTWRKPVEVKRRKIKEQVHHEVAERELSTESKLKSVLPQIYGVSTPSGKAVWERFLKLKRARDSCIHIKYQDQYPLGRQFDQESLFFQFLDNDPQLFPEAAMEMITYFYSKAQTPRWIRQMPHKL